MAAFRLLSLRPSFGSVAPCFRATQRRHARVHSVRFLVTHDEPNRVIEKYREKLDRKAKEHGLRDVDELKAVYQDKIQTQRKKALAPESTSTSISTPTSSPSSSPFPSPPPPPQPQPQSQQTTHNTSQSPNSTKSSSPPGIKPLSSFIDVPKTLALPQKEIEYIWRLRHASNPQSLCAIVPHRLYTRISATAQRHPQFILPLPRDGKGAEIHFLQWTFPTPTTSTVLFTHLAEFKLRGEYAQPHTTVTHHLDLADAKGVVLAQGSVVEGRGISVEEGKWLLMCLQKFYGGEGEGERKKLLEQFSQGDGGFRLEQLLEEAEKIV